MSIPIASLKFPAVNNISYSTTRAKDWDDILTAHTDEAVARTWTMKDKRIGKHVFNVSTRNKSAATVGSVKVRAPAQNTVPDRLTPNRFTGCMRDSMWQFRHHRIVNWRHQPVQHAIWDPAADIQYRTVSSKRTQSVPPIGGQEERRAMCHRTCERRSRQDSRCEHARRHHKCQLRSSIRPRMRPNCIALFSSSTSIQRHSSIHLSSLLLQ